MKKIILICLFALSLFGSGIDWPHDYKKALAQAKQEHKILYVLLTSDNCRWCRKFENTTLQEDVIKEKLAKNFIVVHISRDRDFVPKYFETTPVPRHYFVEGNGKIVFESLGHRGVECFETFMDTALEEHEDKVSK
ncbi:thioredoxin family protein [Sulfurimonas sp. C5]|uniref:thioredoxin family protein n=1 Tax=Sulfurimonas sp. C5 TaxID=3036947 RepID=UPI0024558D85|nr:thioredoxin family protein [Sulfurimonas sp. C5]MDH4943609.1 thioredoxin family protein [Sulfurimonas sp. C5]